MEIIVSLLILIAFVITMVASPFIISFCMVYLALVSISHWKTFLGNRGE